MFRSFFISLWGASAAPASAAPTDVPPGSDVAALLSTFLPIVLIVAVFYFFIIRPEGKRKKEAARMRNELIVGDEITTIGGITGRIIQINDDDIVLESGNDRTQLKIMRWAISSKGVQSAQQQR